MKNFLAFVLVLFVFSSVPQVAVNAQTKAKNVKATTAATTAPKFGNTDGVTAQQMKDHLTFIASDELEGRDTPSRGLDIAAMYIAQHLKSWGVKPAGDNGTYFQKIPLKRSKIDAQGTKLTFNGQNYNYGEDFLASGYIPGNISDSNVVYAGHGWVVKAKNINPYQGIDVKDKIVVVVNNLPKGVTFADLQNGKAGEDWMSPQLYAQANGAKAVIAFGTFANLASWQTSRATQVERGTLIFNQQPAQVTIPTIIAGPRLITALFQGEKSNGAIVFNRGISGEPVDAFDLKATKKASLSVGVKSETIYTQNVVGTLEGADPVLKNEYVAIGAHYDHVGTNPNAPGDDKIWNGADDDGSGTAAVMALAEAFSKGQRPKRSMLFIWHAGEEKGLWGSEYFTNHPTVPITSIITELNIDMIGRAQQAGDTNPANKQLPQQGEVFIIGSRMMSTELGDLSDATNKAFLNLSYNFKYDDPKDPEQYFYRSDHFNYARKGVPIIFYMDGSHADYHQPSDSIEKIDFAQMEKIARTIFATGWELANRPTRPKVDKPLSPDVARN